MMTETKNPDVSMDDAVLSETTKVLDRLISAVELLVENVPNADSQDIQDILSQFDDMILEEEDGYFPHVHMINCPCNSSENLQGRVAEFDGFDEDVEYHPANFNYDLLDEPDDAQDLHRQGRSVSFDDVVRSLLSLPRGLDEVQYAPPDFYLENEDEQDVIVDDDPVVSDEAGDGDEGMGNIEIFHRLMMQLEDEDMFQDEENLGSGDHYLDPPFDE